MLTTAQLPSDLTVNEAVRRWPATVEVFNRFGIDACCGGASAIREAAVRDGASPDDVMRALVEVIARGSA